MIYIVSLPSLIFYRRIVDGAPDDGVGKEGGQQAEARDRVGCHLSKCRKPIVDQSVCVIVVYFLLCIIVVCCLLFSLASDGSQ